VILVPKISAQRRFAAARATYFFWTDAPDEEHLITSAATRDEQASRAFAAELLIPRDYIRSEGTGGKIKMQKLADIAEREDVSRSLIRWHAENNGLVIS
jgi:Zn-dependent peptidase ImmA (M78 family)